MKFNNIVIIRGTEMTLDKGELGYDLQLTEEGRLLVVLAWQNGSYARIYVCPHMG